MIGGVFWLGGELGQVLGNRGKTPFDKHRMAQETLRQMVKRMPKRINRTWGPWLGFGSISWHRAHWSERQQDGRFPLHTHPHPWAGSLKEEVVGGKHFAYPRGGMGGRMPPGQSAPSPSSNSRPSSQAQQVARYNYERKANHPSKGRMQSTVNDDWREQICENTDNRVHTDFKQCHLLK